MKEYPVSSRLEKFLVEYLIFTSKYYFSDRFTQLSEIVKRGTFYQKDLSIITYLVEKGMDQIKKEWNETDT